MWMVTGCLSVIWVVFANENGKIPPGPELPIECPQEDIATAGCGEALFLIFGGQNEKPPHARIPGGEQPAFRGCYPHARNDTRVSISRISFDLT